MLYNLSREYEKAVTAFRTSLQIQPKDYSLWNKLGATLANSSHSADAITAYQRALELKPNYMRAWTNMGISQVGGGAGGWQQAAGLLSGYCPQAGSGAGTLLHIGVGSYGYLPGAGLMT